VRAPWLLAAVLCALAPSAAARAADDAGCPDDLRAVPPALDPRYRHDKALQVEAGIFGGTLLGRTIGSTFLTGARAAFHVDGTWAVMAEYGYSRWSGADPNRHLLTAATTISNDIAMRIARSVLHLDLFLTLGVGAVRQEDRWRPIGRIGGGMKLYPGLPWLAVRIDLDTWVHPIGGRVDTDISLALGVSFLFPSRPAPLEGGPCGPGPGGSP
jgi:hypothetical protein